MTEYDDAKHLGTATATVDVCRAADLVRQAYPKAVELVVWGIPPVTIEDGRPVEHPELVGRPVAVYAKGDEYLWSVYTDMGHGDLAQADLLHELLRTADQALPWLVRVNDSAYWTVKIPSTRQFATAG